MNRFVFSLKNDICFQGIQNIEECIQLVYIYLVDVIRCHISKDLAKRLFWCFQKTYCFYYIGCLFDIKTERGLYSFYRLIAAVYFSKHCSAFQPIASPKALLDSLHFEDNHIKHSLIFRNRRKVVGKNSIWDWDNPKCWSLKAALDEMLLGLYIFVPGIY